MTENANNADNQQERLSQLGNYIAGFVDGEGSFNVSLRKKSDYKLGWQIVLSFNVSQKDPTVLYIMKDLFKCGIIKKRKRDNLFSYDVTKPSDIITNILPFFDKFSFLSESKKRNYLLFKEIVNIASLRPLSYSNFLKIVDLRESLNEGEGRTRKYTKKNIIAKESPETIRQASNKN